MLVGRGSSDPDATSDLLQGRPAARRRARARARRARLRVGGPARRRRRARALPAPRRAPHRRRALPAVHRRARPADLRARPRSGPPRTPSSRCVGGAHLGPDRRLARVVVERYREALTGDVRMNCDLCTYRVRLPGYEDKVGTPIALTPHGDGPARGRRRVAGDARAAAPPELAPCRCGPRRPLAVPDGTPPALAVEGVAYAYPDGTPALAGIDLTARPGRAVAVLGPNGAGKTTLGARSSPGRSRARRARHGRRRRARGGDAQARSAAASASSSRTPTTSSSCRRSRPTSPSARPTRGCAARSCRPASPRRSTPCGWPSSADARAAPLSRRPSAGAPRSPACSPWSPTCSCSTSRPPPLDPAARRELLDVLASLRRDAAARHPRPAVRARAVPARRRARPRPGRRRRRRRARCSPTRASCARTGSSCPPASTRSAHDRDAAIVGLGPGGPEHRTAAAAARRRATRRSSSATGPTSTRAPTCSHEGRRSCAGAMGEEAARADEALALAARGRARRARLLRRRRRVRHGGADAGPRRRAAAAERPAVEVVPGMTAALAAAALLGAPLADDWATLSLSDLHVAVGGGRAAADRAGRCRPRARALQPALAERDRAVRARARGAARAPRAPTRRSRVATRRRRGPASTSCARRSARWTRRPSGCARSCSSRARRARVGRAVARGGARGGPDARAMGGRRCRAGRRRDRHLVGAGPGDPRAAHASPPPTRSRPPRSSSTTARRRTPSSRSRRPAPSAPASAARPGAARSPQDEVNALLVDARPRRPEVVRLKSGDPFVASRGGEEARALHAAGVEVRVVPGVSAALAAPAAAGIPLMVRQLCVTCTVVDGNDDPEHGTPPDWEALARLGGTLVILTGRGRIRRIAAALIAGGLDAGTPVARDQRRRAPGAARPARHARARSRRRCRRPSPSSSATSPRSTSPRARGATMHIPDGFLTGEAAPLGSVAGGGGLAVCLRGAARRGRERDLPVAGLAAAFFLVGDAPLFPVTVGTQGHLLGGLLAVALLGPWLGAVTIAVVCAIQALVLGDGGITTLGLGIVNLALVPAFVGYPLLLALRRVLPPTPRGLALAAGSRAWVVRLLAASIFVVEFALGAVVDDRPHGASPVSTHRRLRGDRGRRGHAHRADPARAPGRAARPRARRRRRCGGERPRRAAAAGRAVPAHERARLRSSAPGRAPPTCSRCAPSRVLGEADVVVWARALVDPAVLEHCRAGRRAGRLRRPHARGRRRDLRARRGARGCASRACTRATRRSTARCTSSSPPAGRSGWPSRSCPASARWPPPPPRSGRS